MTVKRIIIAGSVNADISTRVSRLPDPGETLLAESMTVSGGGKSGNQAVACGRLGGNVSLIARIGHDSYGQMLRENFVGAGVDVRGVSVDTEYPTGQAFIAVSDEGENNIIVVAGANGRLSPRVIEEHQDLLAGASFLSTQLEIPLETVHTLADLCHTYGLRFVLNPSPAASLPKALLALVSLLVLNEHELTLLAGAGEEDEQLERLLDVGIEDVVLTKGGDGVVHMSAAGLCRYAANRVDVVDTTGAGDTFTGALLVGLSESMDFPAAIDFAQKAAAIQVTRRGAQDAVPTRAEVDAARLK